MANVGRNSSKTHWFGPSLEIFSAKNITRINFCTCNDIFVIFDYLKDALKSSATLLKLVTCMRAVFEIIESSENVI